MAPVLPQNCRIIGDRLTRDEAFIPVANPERHKALMRELADDDGVIRGIPGGPVQLVGWPDAWAAS